MKVYLVYNECYDLEECACNGFLEEVCASMDIAKDACRRLADELLEELACEGFNVFKDFDENGNIVVHKLDNDEPLEDNHFVVDEWNVLDY